MGKIKLFPVPEYSSKQSSDPVVPLVPCTGIFLGPSKSGKTVALISLQRKITETSKKLMKKLHQVLIILDDLADMPQLHKPNGALDTLFIKGPSHADKELGELAEAAAHQRSRAGQPAIPLLLEAAQPARAGRRGGGAQRPAAEGAALPVIRAGDAGTLQFPFRLLPEAEE